MNGWSAVGRARWFAFPNGPGDGQPLHLIDSVLIGGRRRLTDEQHHGRVSPAKYSGFGVVAVSFAPSPQP